MRTGRIAARLLSLSFVASLAVAAACGALPENGDQSLASSAGQGQTAEITGFGSNPGGLQMFLYTPPHLSGNAPLVIAMHGCTQSASAYVAAGWNPIADADGFYVVYPQTTANNDCFVWYNASDARRGAGQAASIAQMVQYMTAHYPVDPHRVYVTGLSAGGAMTAVMAAAYPDLFAAGAVMSGLPFRCADTQTDAYSCMNGAKTKTPAQWGDLVRGADPAFSATWPRMAVWHGASDYTVVPANADELVTQWTNVLGIDATADSTETVGAATHTQYKDGNGTTLVESWRIASMGHGTAVDPAHGCGTAGAFILDVGVCSSHYAAQFFGLESATNPTPTPTSTSTSSPTPTLTPSPSPTSTPSSTCQQWHTSNYAHTQAGRATQHAGHAFTIGGNDDLGLWNTYVTTWVYEPSPGNYYAGQCP